MRRHLFDRIGWAAAGALGIALIAVLAGVVRAGPLDPPGPPASTSGVLRPGTPITSLPYTISQPGNYYLTGNLTMATSGDGITINSDDVTLDLGGFTIDGGGVGTNGVVVPSRGQNLSQSITVQNGNAEHFTGAGFQLQYGTSMAKNLQASHDKDGIVIDGGTLDGCTVQFDSEYGVEAGFTTITHCNAEVDGTGFDLFEGTLSECLADNNTNAGINIQRGDVHDCTVHSNFYGILVTGASNVHHNQVEFSGSDGIRVVTNGGSIISDNTSLYGGGSQTASGIYVETDDNRITHNTTSNTTGVGINCVGNFNTIDDNSTFDNTGIGIVVGGSKNTVVKNSSTGNVNRFSSTNYSIGAGGTYGANNPGPVAGANAATLPWSNTQ